MVSAMKQYPGPQEDATGRGPVGVLANLSADVT